MAVYSIAFLIPFLAALSPRKLNKNLSNHLWKVYLFSLFLFIGTRYQVGGDWLNFIHFFYVDSCNRWWIKHSRILARSSWAKILANWPCQNPTTSLSFHSTTSSKRCPSPVCFRIQTSTPAKFDWTIFQLQGWLQIDQGLQQIDSGNFCTTNIHKKSLSWILPNICGFEGLFWIYMAVSAFHVSDINSVIL